MNNEARTNLYVDAEVGERSTTEGPAEPGAEPREETVSEGASSEHNRSVSLLARVERLVQLRVDEARVKVTHLAESQIELIRLAGAVRDLSKTAAGITRRTQFLSMAAEDNLQPAACAVILLARILKNVYGLSSVTKDTVEAQSAAMRELTEIVGEAAQVSSYLTGKVAALAEETRSVLPALSRKNLVDAELQCLTGELEKALTEFPAPEAGIDAVTPQQPAEPQAIN